MNKTFVKYLFSLVILVLSFTNQLMARSHKEGENIVSSSTSNSSFHNALLDSHQSPVFSVPVSERGEKVFFDANEKEVEEDEAILASSEHIQGGNAIASLFFSWYHRLIQLRSPQFSYYDKNLLQLTPNKLFIVFRVIRL
ncbi:hypothetical protein [Cellulophaga sp. BC115SP]|uniref:hypothetical protein n=1 Tax=Cellulophaga sp. BC115SP TaxID=2683263 RepID=UPI0014133A1E|nr:hypothetical protein [Cellulophaga sp. BC115SP]NBB26933.1 hypothetical protein [Cellulophaga sp. BC115SP]